ncbi:hypothetical protein K439DRAFT_491515 [Ramaria rubella]|nr:hypothetical protein K439DRAFT_491515 [Ramaria rubella]
MDDNGIEVRITDYDLTLPGPDAGGVDPRSQSPPSPRDLFLGPGMIIPETQSSPQSKSHISTDGSTDTKTPSPSRKGKGNKGKPAKGSCNRDTYSKPTSKQKLGPVPVLSPSVFKRCVNEPPSIPPDSSIETFTTPSQTKLKSKSLAYSQRQEEEEEEEETLDAIEDYDDAPHDPSHPLVLVRKMRERSQLLGDPKPPRKSLDVISNSASSDINFEVLADEDAGRADSVLLGDELRPEDAPDARGHVGLSRPPEIPPSGDVNDSLEANAALTQQSNPMRLVIASPVRQLDNALGLLHRKSEEIHQYKMLLETCHSRTTELEAHVNSLKDRLKAAEGRHEESQAALDKERAVRVMVEEQPEEEKTTKNSPSSPLRHGDHVTQLLEENAQLRKVNAQLESDTDMFRKLYAQASEAHMTRLMDIKTLSRDNDSLREQAKNGVKQAGTFWATQVHTLEAQLSRSQGVVHVLTTQARRTDDDVRRRAALLPMVQREVEVTKDELEEWKEKVVELGRENTKLRIEVKEYEDEAMARRRKERARKDQETVAAEELIWMCPWMDAEHRTKCGALLESREKLREHFYEANHI